MAGRIAAVGGWLFVAGTVLFSGSLYALALSGVRWLGAITPLGGVAFLAGWACLALAARRGRPWIHPGHDHRLEFLPPAPHPPRRLVRRCPPGPGGIVPCHEGCTACCHGPFDISVADAELIGEASTRYPRPTARGVTERAQPPRTHARRARLAAPYAVDALGEDRFDRLTDALATEPCPLLDDTGRCGIYSGPAARLPNDRPWHAHARRDARSTTRARSRSAFPATRRWRR